MYAVGRLGSYLSRGVYTVSGPFHPFGGAVDIVVVEQPDGSFKSSPWYVRFGKFQGVLKTKEKVVTISVNGVEANFHMYLDHKGEAYFLREVDVEEGEAPLYPLSSGEEADEPFVRDRRPMKSMNCNYETGKRKSVEQFDAGNGKIVSRTTSRRSRIFGLVFGRRSMKEDSYQEGEDGPGVVRVSSLERAEIAADLLEMKWSTNLVSHNYRKEKSFRFSASGSMKNTGDRDMQVEDKQEKCVSSVFDNDGRKVSDPSLQNETASSQSQGDGNISGSGMEVQDCAEDVIVRMSSVSSTEEDAEASRSVETSLEEKHRVSPNASRNDYHDETASGSVLRSTCDPDRRIQYEEGDSVCSCSSMPNEDSVSESVPSFAYYEASQNSLMRLSGSTEQTCESRHVTGGEYEEARIQVKTLLLRADLSSEGAPIKQAEEMELNIEEAITRPEVSYDMTGDNQQLGFLQELELRSLSTTSNVGDSDGQVKTDKSNAEQIDDCVANTLSSPPSESSEEEQFVFSDLDEFKLHRSDYVKNEHHASSARTEKEEYQVTSMSGCSHSSMNPFSQDNQLADVKISNEQSDMTQSPIRTLSSNSNCGKGPQKVESLPDMQSPYSKLDAYYHCSLSHSLDSSSELTKMEFLCKDDSAVQEAQLADISSCNRSSKVTSSPMDILSSQSVKTVTEVESFPSIWSPYGKLDVYDHPQSHSMDSNLGSLKMEIFCRDDSVIQGDRSADSIENSIKKLRSISIPNDMISSFGAGIEKPEQQGESLPEIESRSDACENHPLDHFLSSSSDSMKTESFSEDNSSGENHPSADSKSSLGKLRSTSNPINILSSSRVASDRSGRQVESLPNMWSSDVKLEAHDRHPLSHSLGSENESRKMVLFSKDELSYQKPNAEEKCQIMDESQNTEVSWTSWNLNDVHKHPAVELSLCKHLLFEGMGADAAARAFDVAKLDLNKFKAIGSAVMKNDRLVVRIGGRYFPSPAAAPILLGMVAFGSQEIFEPKGMIPVDRHEGDQRKDGGSWRIWPFSFKRSRSRINMPIDLTDARNDVGNAVDKTTFIEDVEEILVKPKKVKKMIRATTPTSEQLASLNLKEGSNTVTFTFSTSMLGNQKVDARIYLWKWKTRIVISDVDGTITKSDVLGQFMPLMGVDWSQTGVAHLFSGIKENGYHLLFLSARAISQAYHTRQFLVNLKQDGKALPDGPIVISPDGLFPSLYREVIRRAPHEFKIACLEDIKALFPPDYNPFYAGFGNRDTDEISYLKVGIPKGKIFIINPKGEVAVNRHLNTKSYTSLRTLVNDMFPPVTTSEQEDFNSWNYWKLPPPLIDI